MLEPETNCLPVGAWDGFSAEQQRLKALSELGLIEAQTIPNFEEATQTAAYLLDSPICILGFWIRTASGLSPQWVYHSSD